MSAGAMRMARAAPMFPAPSGKTILTISGRISGNAGKPVEFDRGMLEALGTSGFTTSTPWYTGLTRFDGVPMERP